MRIRFLLLAACASLASCGTPEMVHGPNWDGSRITEGLTPPSALSTHKEGWAFLICTAQADRSVTDCSLLEESPPGWGFGEAALKMQARLRINSHAVPAGERLIQPIAFCQPNSPMCVYAIRQRKEELDRQLRDGSLKP